MDDDLDGQFALLAAQPLPARLQGLERQVQLGLEGRERANPSWRYAAVGLALFAGLGVGATAATLREPSSLAADLSDGTRLAPSGLL